MDISGTGATGTGTAADPIVVEKGATYSMTVSQHSSYTDPDGTAITRDPKASLSLSMTNDTVVCKDLKELTAMTTDMKTTDEGTSPRTMSTLQTFNVGGQKITFNTAYEIYKIVNSAGKTIELPYVKMHNAKYGTATSTEQTRAALDVTSIRLTPINTTRSITVKDSTAYNVSVSFNLDIGSMNTRQANKQNLSFTVSYVGIVETSTEYPDPETKFAYELNVLGGTTDKTSPFTLTNVGTMSLEWQQTVMYTYFSMADLAMKSINYEPKAAVKLSADADTIWAKTSDEFEAVVEGKPTVTTTTEGMERKTTNQVFEIGEQKISAEWMHEVCRGKTPEGNELAMPYLELGDLKLVSVSAVKKGSAEDAEEINGKTAEVYEITAKFSQELSSKFLPHEVKQTLEYVVKYIGAVEITLADVKYRKSYEWYPSHDNLQMSSQLIIYRDRIYSNGVTFTDEYRSNRMAVDWLVIGNIPPPYCNNSSLLIDQEGTLPNGDKVFWHGGYKNYVDTGGVVSCKTRVPDIEAFKAKLRKDDFPKGTPGDNATYYGADGKGNYDPDNPREGWYIKPIERRKVIDMKPLDDLDFLRQYQISVDYRDRFRYIKDNIDERLIDFPEYWMTHNLSFTETRTTTPEGYPARVAKHECKAKYLGKDFYWAVIDTIYQTTPLKSPPKNVRKTTKPVIRTGKKK